METKKIAIVGAGTSGYLSVLYFCTKYPQHDIHWIYPENNVTIGVGESTVPQVKEFFEDLGISFNEIIKIVGGSLKLGIKFENFAPETFYHPFYRSDIEGALIEYMMKHNKIPNDIEEYDIAFHINVGNLAPFLDTWFKRFSNLTIDRRTVQSVDEVDCDWFIDCTGFKRAFVNQYYSDNLVTISDRVPNNKAFVYRGKILDHKRMPYTSVIGMNSGWVWNIPMKDQISIGYVHHDKFDVKQEFLNYLKNEGYDNCELAEVKMVTGRNKKHYAEIGTKKLVSVGLSSAFIEPMEATGLYFTVFAIEHLDKLMRNEISSNEYEDIVNHEFDVLIDFIVAHYKFSHHDNEYWSFYKNVPSELYRENKAFPVKSWNYILRERDKTPEVTPEQISQLGICRSFHEWLKEKNYL
jgi:tryptophan halogenase